MVINENSSYREIADYHRYALSYVMSDPAMSLTCAKTLRKLSENLVNQPKKKFLCCMSSIVLLTRLEGKISEEQLLAELNCLDASVSKSMSSASKRASNNAEYLSKMLDAVDLYESGKENDDGDSQEHSISSDDDAQQ